MTPKTEAILAALTGRYPDAVCSLTYGGDPWRLLVMARLSAQCTDARVNIVCESLFARFPDAASMAAGDLSEIEDLVRPCGLFRTKAASIREISVLITEKYGGKVPSDMDELLSLPGVGRKIANLIRGDVFGLPAVVTDTHCIRIAGRLGFYPEEEKDPKRIEKILVRAIDPPYQSDFCHRLVLFGRDICTARAPKCDICPLAALCTHAQTENHPENKQNKNKASERNIQ